MALGWDEDTVMRSVKAQLLSRRGTAALVEAARSFRAKASDNKDGALSIEDFASALTELGVKIVSSLMAHIVRSFAVRPPGGDLYPIVAAPPLKVSVDHFLSHLIHDGLNPRRKRAVSHAYATLHASGTLTVAALGDAFRAGSTQSVLVGATTEDHARKELLESFGAVGAGEVTKEDFDAYYSAVAATQPHDDVFEALVLRSWGTDPATAPRLDATQRAWDATGDPIASQPPLFLTQALSQTLHSGSVTKKYDTSLMQRVPLPFVPNPSLKPDYVTSSQRDYVRYTSAQIVASDPTRVGSIALASSKLAATVVSPTNNKQLDGVRQRILSAVGEDGFNAVRRAFAQVGVDYGARVDVHDVGRVLGRIGVHPTPYELDTLFKAVGPSPTLRNVVAALRGPIYPASRATAVRQAYARLGIRSVSAMAARIDVGAIPVVAEGRKGAEEFLNAFRADMTGIAGGDAVSADDWAEYYANLSCSTGSDAFFELLLQNTWHIKL